MPSVSKLYHGSPVGGLQQLEPRFDPRTGRTALFVTQYPEHAAIHALLENRARSEIDHTTKGGKFISGKAITPSPLLDQGYLYSLTGPEDAEELDEPTNATLDRVVTPEMIQAMGWDVEVRPPGAHAKQADLAVVPEMLPPDIPESDQLYQAWKANPSPALMGPLITSMRPLMESQLGKYKGTLPPGALRGQAKKFMAGAVKSYDPTRGTKLTSHVVNSLQQLHRKNYEAQSAFRLSEELQRGIGAYHRSMENLRSVLGREPTLEDISDDLGWPVGKIQRLARQDRGEVHGEDLSYDPIDPYQDSADPVIDYVYHDLSPEDKVVMELATGYGGKAKLAKTEIAKILKVTPARVTQRSLEIAKKIKAATEA